MGVPSGVHRVVRALTGWYPYKTPAPGTYTTVRDLLAPLGYAPHRFRDGERVSVSDDDVTGREDVLFAVASPL